MYLRLRPLLKHEQQENKSGLSTIEVQGETMVQLNAPHVRYAFVAGVRRQGSVVVANTGLAIVPQRRVRAALYVQSCVCARQLAGLPTHFVLTGEFMCVRVHALSSCSRVLIAVRLWLRQEEVFLEAAQPLIDSCWRGQHGLIFAYGVTNSGESPSHLRVSLRVSI